MLVASDRQVVPAKLANATRKRAMSRSPRARIAPPRAHRHPWPRTVAEARALQEQLRGYVVARDQLGPVHTVAGVDVGFEDGGRITRAAAVVLDYPSLAPREQALARVPTRFPYVPGYLSFREIRFVPIWCSAMDRDWRIHAALGLLATLACSPASRRSVWRSHALSVGTRPCRIQREVGCHCAMGQRLSAPWCARVLACGHYMSPWGTA